MLRFLKRYGFVWLLIFVSHLTYAQTLQLSSPNGGETWLGGSVQNIIWTYNNVDNIKIEYSLNNGLNWNVISASTPASALSYAWTVPSIGSNQVKVRLTNILQYTQDESNTVFTIPEPTVDVIYPNGGESFGAATGQYLEWLTTGVTTLKVQYTTNNGSSWTDVGNFNALDGYCNWTIPSTLTSQVRIRAYNIENPVNRDSSLALFNIVSSSTVTNDKYKGGNYDGYSMVTSLSDTIKVASPNGGESLYPASTTTISWVYRNVDQVKIEYSTNNGSSWSLIANGIPASQLSYNWTIPNTPSTECLIKVSDVTNYSLFDISNSTFTINASSVTLIYPNGGESFGAGTGQYIEWDYNSVTTVKLEYSTNNGSTWTTIGTAPAADKYANWILPAVASSQCLVRVSDNSVSGINDVSSTTFSLITTPLVDANKYKGGMNDGYSLNTIFPDSIKVVSPNGGENWSAGSVQNITWTYNDVDNVSIEFSLDDGQTWSILAANIPASQLSYSWTVPTTPSYTCRIRIKDITRNISDQNDAAFIIPNSSVQLLYPNGGESFSTGSGQYIEWTYTDLTTVKLEYSTNNGSSWTTIGTAPASDKYANWIVPASVSSQCLIRISDNNNVSYSDQSNAVFSTYNSSTFNQNKYYGGAEDGYAMYAMREVALKVLTPNGGEIFGNGTTEEIKWTVLNTTDNLKLEYSIDNEATWNLIADSIPFTQNTYNWDIYSAVSSICKVRLSTMSGLYFDKSDNFFTIANTSGITTGTLTGNTFCSGSSTSLNFNISTSFNSGNRFIVQLSDSIGKFSGVVKNIGEITSVTPQNINITFPSIYFASSLYRVRVISTSPPTIGTNNESNIVMLPLPNIKLGRDTIICQGTSLSLNAGNTATSYLWNTGSTSSSISVNQAGTFYVTATNACGQSKDTIVIQQKLLPTVNLGRDTLICLNSALTLDAGNTATTYTWSNGANSRNINVVTSGTYSVTLTNSCGSASDEINIGIRPTLTVDLGTDRGICLGQWLTIDAGNSGATYHWSNGSTTQTINVNSAGTYVVDVNNGCGNISNQITLYNGTFTVNAGVDQNICLGESAMIKATGANTYTWNTGAITNSSIVSPSVTTVYTVSASNIYNCTSTDQVSIFVNALPSVAASSSGSVCLGEQIHLNASGGTSYIWSGPNSYTSNVQNPIITLANSQMEGVYSVSVTQNGCTSTQTLNIKVNALPNLTLSAASSELCLGETTTLNVSGADTYTWSTNENTSSISVTPTTTTIYSVTATNNLGCVSTQSLTIKVNPLPSLTISVTSAELCLGETTTLTVSGADTYTWSTNENTSSIAVKPTSTTIYTVVATNSVGCISSQSLTIKVNALPSLTVSATSAELCLGETTTLTVSGANTYTWSTNENTSSIAVTPTATTIYTVTATNSLGCSSNESLIIKVNALPSLTVSAKSSELCLGETTTLTVNGADTYTWSTNENSSSIAITPTATTIYTVVATNSVGCISSQSLTIKVNALPSLTISATSTEFCLGETTTLTVNGADTYTWSTNENLSSIAVTPTSTTIYTVVATNSVGCTSTKSLTVKVNALPSLTVSATSAEICFGETTTLTVNGADTYTWSTNENSSSIAVTPTVTTIYTVVATNNAGCISSQSLTIKVNVLPSLTVSATSAELCLGETATLTVIGADTYTWSTNENTSSISVTPTITNNYTVVATNSIGCTSTQSMTIKVNVLPSLTVSATFAELCLGETTTLTVSGADTYTWSTNENTGSITVTPTATTIYTVVATNSVGCISSQSLTIKVNALPSLTISATSATICFGETTTLTASDANTYTWSTNENSSSIAVTPTLTTIYSVTATNSLGCSSNESLIIKVNALPSLTVSATSVELCLGETTTLTVSGADTYTWSTNENTRSIAVTPTATTIYTVVATNSVGCISSQSLTVKVNALPSLTVSATSSELCLGETTTLIVNGADTYTWSTNENTSSISVTPTITTNYTVVATNSVGCISSQSLTIKLNALPSLTVSATSAELCLGETATLTVSGADTYTWSTNENTSSISVTPTITTNYTVVATNSVGCISSQSLTIKLNALPSLTVSATSVELCLGETATLTVSGADTYTWSTNENSSSIAITPTLTTIYTVTATNNLGCVSTQSINVKVNALPSLTVSATSAELCLGETTTLTASGADTYTWSSNENMSSIAITPTLTTIYSVTATNSLGCSSNESLIIKVNALPSLTVSATSAELCLGETTTLTASGADTYTWSSNENTSSIAITPILTTIYTVTATNSAGCTTTQSLTAKVNALPSLTVSATSTTICSGTTASLTVSGADTYTWSPGNVITDVYWVTPATSMVYTVVGSNSIGCSTTQTIGVKINPTPTITINASSSDICAGTTVTLSALGASSYNWSTGEITNVIIVKPNETTTYTLSGGNSDNCLHTQLIPISVSTMSLSFNLKPVSCGLKDGSVKVLVVGNNPPFNYQWTVNNGIQNTDSISKLAAGIYTIMIKDSKNCQIIDSVSVQSKSSDLQLNFTTKDVTGCGNKMNGSIDLSVSGSITSYSVTWSNGTTTEDLNGISPGIYSVAVTTTDNCTSTATVSVINNSSSKGVNCLLTIYNGFTPNGDGINDYFLIENIENYFRNIVYIYNRWGAELYHTVEYNNDHNYWDGTYQGKRVPVGTYFYVIMDEKEEVIKKGWIEVTD